MAYIRKILLMVLLVIIISFLNNVTCEEPDKKPPPKIEAEEELIQSETKDGKLEIIKRIKKVNPDGSYTIGYEADDGSFKIESRDVLGNIKGTYGFIDDEGEVKRVSYSSSNASEAFTKHDEPPNVSDFPSQNIVQRIAKSPQASASTTNKPPIVYPSTTTTSNLNPPTTTPITSSVIQSIARRRQTTLKPPNYNAIKNIKPNSVIYTSAAPRVLLQRPSLASTVSTIIARGASENRSEGQISRPEVSYTPTQLPLTRNLPSKRFEADEKPVTEEASEVRANILRRQLPPQDASYKAEEHLYSLQQSLGHNDVSDIYNNGVTITSRPLFTTTKPHRAIPSVIISSTTAAPVAVPKPTAKYVANYQRSQLQEQESSTAVYNSQPTEEDSSPTTTNVPVVQIPANSAATPEPLVAIRHPFQPGAILVPLSQLQNRIIPVENMQDVYDARRHYVTTQAPLVEVERQNLKRLNPVALRPLPVQVDQDGFIREMPRHVARPYPLPVPIQDVSTNEIDNIQPPVSTKDFQTLLNHLITRQKRLERISALTNPKVHHPDIYQPQPVKYLQRVVPTQQPYFVQRVVAYDHQQRQEAAQPQPQPQQRQYVAIRPQQAESSGKSYQYHYQQQEDVDENEEPRRTAATYERKPSTTYFTNRRTGRLLLPTTNAIRHQVSSDYVQEESQTEEYLPPDVREMLLLRMLQLAMNPALPLDGADEAHQQVATSTTPQYRRAPMRNVEILGEEKEEEPEVTRTRKPASRTKRYREEDMEYME